MDGNEFHYGDVVVLKSGGPPMTVSILPGDPVYVGAVETWSTYECVWFRGAQKETGRFEEYLLKLYKGASR